MRVRGPAKSARKDDAPNPNARPGALKPQGNPVHRTWLLLQCGDLSQQCCDNPPRPTTPAECIATKYEKQAQPMRRTKSSGCRESCFVAHHIHSEGGRRDAHLHVPVTLAIRIRCWRALDVHGFACGPPGLASFSVVRCEAKMCDCPTAAC